MKFSHSWLSKYLPALPSPERVAELLTRYSFEVEDLLDGEHGKVLDVDVLPNRASDCLSHFGVARELKAILAVLNKKTPRLIRPASYSIGQPKKNLYGTSIKVKDKEDCPRYSLGVFVNVKVGASPEWLQRELMACGLKPINNVVDITNFVMLELGQPLHAFDADPISSPIIVRRAKKGESLMTIDGQSVELSPRVLVIADKKNIQGLAGIKGGRGSEISLKTTKVFLEAANFNPSVIRKGSQEVRIMSDAARRFSARLHPRLTETAMARCARLLQEIAKADFAGWLDISSAVPERTKPLKLDIRSTRRMIGEEIKTYELERIFKALDIKIISSKNGVLRVLPPWWRSDINSKQELIEEVARLYGYHRLGPKIPRLAVKVPLVDKNFLYAKAIRSNLAAFGYTELLGSNFLKEDIRNALSISTAGLVALANPLQKDRRYLSPSSLLVMLEAVVKNLASVQDEPTDKLALSIEGRGFRAERQPAAWPIREEIEWTLALWHKLSKNPSSLFELRADIEGCLRSLGINKLVVEKLQPAEASVGLGRFFAEGSVAKIRHPSSREMIGMFGILSAVAKDNLGIEGDISCGVIYPQRFKDEMMSDELKAPPAYPPVTRDLSILINEQTSWREVELALQQHKIKHLRKFYLLDVYEGSDLPAGRRSLTLRFVFQSARTTLTDEKVNSEMRGLEKLLERRLQARIR